MPLTIAIVSAFDSEPLRYVLNTIFMDWWDGDIELINQTEQLHQYDACISYGKKINGCLYIPAEGLLQNFQSDAAYQSPAVLYHDDLPVIFKDASQEGLGFDVFSAVFWCLTRYEEYFPFTPDAHGRFPHTDSWAFKNNLLQTPIVDQWVAYLKGKLETQFSIDIDQYDFKIQPSYDIDIAWSYKYKGLKRTVGGYFKDLLHGRWHNIAERTKVLIGKTKDPFDCFDYLNQLHKSLAVTPYYFLLCAEAESDYDKNNPRQKQATRDLYQRLSLEGQTGLHPSYYCMNDEGKLQNEIQYLRKLLDEDIEHSRQHYIRCRVPDTWTLLCKADIPNDYSMGYSTINGFKAGTSRPFYAFDLHQHLAVNIRIHPFIFMDTASFFEQNQSAMEAFAQLRQMTDAVKNIGGTVTTIMHNFSLGSDAQWQGWRQAYESYLRSYL